MAEQRLAGEPFATPAEAVAHLGAVQAQEYAEAKWSLAERVAGCTDADVEDAFSRGEILRTHVLRPTWHFVTPADLRWMLRLTAPRVHAFNRYWYAQVGLDDATIERSKEVIASTLADGEPRTRRELGAALEAAGVDEPKGGRLAHIAMYAELDGLVCSGPRRGKQHTYALLDHRAPGARELDGDEALAELTRRYFTSHGPATVKDFAWWSGLKVTDVRRGLDLVADGLAKDEDEDGVAWYSAPAPAAGEVRGGHLIPMYDELGVAYKDLRMVLAAEGTVERPILVDGLCVGSWKRTLGRGSVVVEAALFTRLDEDGERALNAAVARFGEFLGLEATLDSTAARL